MLRWRELELPGSTLTNMRSWCRFRCGQLVLRHLLGRKSVAVFQRCIFCGERLRNATVHVLSSCDRWARHRNDLGTIFRMSPARCRQGFSLHALRTESPEALSVLCLWFAEVDKDCYTFWLVEAENCEAHVRLLMR